MKTIKLVVYVLLMVLGVYCIASAQSINDLEYQKFQEDDDGNVAVNVIIGAGDLGIDGDLTASTIYVNGNGDATITSGSDLVVLNDNVDINGDATISSLASGTGVVYFTTANSDGKLSRSALAYPGGVGGTGTNYWTDGGALTYLTSATDDLAAGGNDTNASLYFDESAGDLFIDGVINADGGVTTAGDIQSTGDNMTITGMSIVNLSGATMDIRSDNTSMANLTKTGSSFIMLGAAGTNKKLTSDGTDLFWGGIKMDYVD